MAFLKLIFLFIYPTHTKCENEHDKKVNNISIQQNVVNVR